MQHNDLTEYSDNELSMLVFNDEGLYLSRFINTKQDYIDMGFIFTSKQWEVLQDDLQDDLEENS